MKLLLLLAVSAVVVDVSLAEDCKTKNGKVCAVGHPFNSYFNANPCFDYMKKGSVCFYDATSNFVEHCDCSIAACNCEAPDESPDESSSNDSSSDNSSSDYSSSECSSEKTTYCPLGDDNTMCKYCGVDKTNCGKDIITREITDKSEQDTIVDKHNELRRKVAKGDETKGATGPQPKASNMNELVWDDEVAKMAQTWADQCSSSPAHDKNRNMVNGNAGGLYCGQNVYSSWSSVKGSSKALEQAVQSWYNEVKDFDNSAVASFFMKGGGHTDTVGHYTQVVWADVSKIGCGYIYRVDPSFHNYYKEYVVCNYCKGGNMGNSPIYKTGDPATACPDDHPTPNDGLCKK